MTWTPIKAVYVSATTTIPAETTTRNVRIRNIHYHAASVGGEVIITHTSANGGQVVKFGVPSSGVGSLDLPEAGLLCSNGFYVTQPADTRLTIFYDG
jgi:hypothetical protein